MSSYEELKKTCKALREYEASFKKAPTLAGMLDSLELAIDKQADVETLVRLNSQLLMYALTRDKRRDLILARICEKLGINVDDVPEPPQPPELLGL
jgi:hypothetical protein